MAEKLLKSTSGQAGQAIVGCPLDALSDRELEVLRLIGQGAERLRSPPSCT